MKENDFNFDAITRFQSYRAQRKYKKLFLFFPFLKNLKAATGSCSVKKSVLRCVFAWKSEALWIVESRGTLTKLGALFKVCLFAWDIDVFWIKIWRTNSKQPGKIRYCILVKIDIFS